MRGTVILVQVNAGEAFTIQREDGQCQCITGPAQVPMMSPNGSVPPIYVPTGYVSQVIEENGVRRVLVIPQPDFHPRGPSPLPPPPPPHGAMPAFIPHPAMIQPLPHPMYSGLGGGVGDLNSQYISQYHNGHIFSELDSHCSPRRPQFFPRDERAGKTYNRLQKRLKGRHTWGGGVSPTGEERGSPPSSPQKNQNRHSDGQDGLEVKETEPELNTASEVGEGRSNLVCGTRMSPFTDPEDVLELDEESKALRALLSTISDPVVGDIQACNALLTWCAPTDSPAGPLTYEVFLCVDGEGCYRTAYSGQELSTMLEDLKPATNYRVRVRALCDCLPGDPCEEVRFTTLSCEPDTPSPPWRCSRTKSSIFLQWKAPCDNGSKIHSYLLEWDEGKGTGMFEQCYCGPLNQYEVMDLSPAIRYYFRLAARNDIGLSGFSDAVGLFTSSGVPTSPLAPELVETGSSWLSLRWKQPEGVPRGDDILYFLEMEEEDSVCGFQPRYDGYETTYTVRNLRRSTRYKCQVTAYSPEGKSNPSQVSEFTTRIGPPDCPRRLAVKGKIQPNSFRVSWEPPEDDGGSSVAKYVLEVSEGTNGMSWEQVYSGPDLEQVCEGLKPGRLHLLRVYCVSEGGQSPLSETLQLRTPAVAPGPCLPPKLVGRPKAREVQLRWAPPQVDGGSAALRYAVELSVFEDWEHKEVYQGPELECTVSCLLPGKTYRFRLRASNEAGCGPFSEYCEVTTNAGVPEACKVPHVVCRSPTCAVVSWETPPGNGAQVTEFRLEWGASESNMQMCYCGPGLSHELRGLQPASQYFCRVQAVNSAGAGPGSEITMFQTPCSVPGPVPTVQAQTDAELCGDSRAPLYCPSSCLGLRWEPPCDHGAGITAYFIDLGERQPIAVGPINRYIIQHLQPDTSYRIRIQAQNSLGVGPFSPTVRLKTKPLPPQPPRLECTASTHQTLKLKWGETSSRAGASEPLQYQLQMEDRYGRFVCVYRGPCHTHKVQRLSESTSYTFRIQAFNEVGEGSFSELYTFITPRSPPALPKAPRLERLDDHTCEVIWEAVPPLKGDPIIYTLQCMLGNSEFKQVYRGPSTSFLVSGLQPYSEYRFRVGAIRQCPTPPDLAGPFSSTAILPSRRSEANGVGVVRAGGAEMGRTKSCLSDEQCAALIVLLFAIVSILIAFVIQYFVIK